MKLNLTNQARKVLCFAQVECRRFNHGTVETCHLLAGFVSEGAGVARNVLRNLALDLRTVRLEIEKLGLPELEEAMVLEGLPRSDALDSVLVRAQEMAQQEHHTYAGTEHLLLALLEIPANNFALGILAKRGITPEMVRQDVNALLGIGVPMVSSLPLPALPPCRDPGVLFWPAELLWARYKVLLGTMEAQSHPPIAGRSPEFPDLDSPTELAQALHKIATLAEDLHELRARWQILLLWGYEELWRWYSWKLRSGLSLEEKQLLTGKWLAD